VDCIVNRFWPTGDRFITLRSLPGPTLWHVRTGRRLWTVEASALDAQVFPDGSRVAMRGADGAVVVRDAASGQAVQHLDSRDHDMLVLGNSQLVTWNGVSSPDGRPATIWNVTSGSPRHELWMPPGREVYALAASPCSSTLATWRCGDEHVIYVWDVEAGRLQWELRPPPASALRCIFDLAVSRGGERIVAEGFEELFVWDGITGELHRHLPLTSSNWFTFLPGGRHFVAANSSGAAVWDSETGQLLVALEGGALVPPYVDEGGFEVSPCGRLVAVCGLNDVDQVESLAVWDTLSGRMLAKRVRHTTVPAEAYSCGVRVAPMATMAQELLD